MKLSVRENAPYGIFSKFPGLSPDPLFPMIQPAAFPLFLFYEMTTGRYETPTEMLNEIRFKKKMPLHE